MCVFLLQGCKPFERSVGRCVLTAMLVMQHACLLSDVLLAPMAGLAIGLCCVLESKRACWLCKLFEHSGCWGAAGTRSLNQLQAVLL